MTKKQVAILVIWFGTYTALRAFNVQEWVIWTILLIVFLVGIVDYYWLNGKLSGRSYKNAR